MKASEFRRLVSIQHAIRASKHYTSRTAPSKRSVRHVFKCSGRTDMRNGKVFSEVGLDKLFPVRRNTA